MNIKCGIDIIEISRVKSSIENFGKAFINKIYTDDEVAYCESRGKQKYQHYAARFAAKEAAFKAISEILKDKYDLTWKDYEVKIDQNGRPKLNIHKLEKDEIASIDISLSHCKEYAVANVVVLLSKGVEGR